MVGCGMLMVMLFALATWYSCRESLPQKRWLLKLAFISLPLPWIASQAGWIVAEYGRQPWAVGEILPVNMAASQLEPGQIMLSIAMVYVLYTLFLIVETFLMVRYAKLGPSAIKTGRYHFETQSEDKALTSATSH